MIAPVLADVIRWASAGLSLLLVLAACYAALLSRYPDQRVRFGLFAVFGVLLTTGHLAALGLPGSWRLPALLVAVALAVWSTVVFARRELGERRHGR